MNRFKAARLGLMAALSVVAIFAAFAPSAFAQITTKASTIWGSTVPGAHTDYTITQDFEYGNGEEPTASTGTPGEDLKKWITDSPAGLIGNPNAIPYDKRCAPEDFDPTPEGLEALNAFFIGSCPASAKVGEADVYLVNDADTGSCPAIDPEHPFDPDNPFACIPGGFDLSNLGGPLHGDIYLLRTEPEVPAKFATILTSETYQNVDFSMYSGIKCETAPATPCTIQPKSLDSLEPVTNRSADLDDVSDFRIRTIPTRYEDPPNAILPTAYGHESFDPLNETTPTYGTQLHIRQISEHIFGMVDPNETPGDTSDDVPFLTNPMRCDSWDSYSYAIDWSDSGGTLAMDPRNPDDDSYVKSAADSVTPSPSECAQMPALNVVTSAAVNGSARGANPGLTVSVNDSTPLDAQQPSKMVTTLPASMSVDVKALSHVCTYAQRDADACPAESQVGTAKVETPLVSAGLTGRVYMTTGQTPGLPFLSIFVDGAVKFRLDATTRFVGPSVNQIETTFDNLPQAPFSKFSVTIDGGAPGKLLFNRECPLDGEAPADGPITFAVSGVGGGTASSASATKLDPCYGATTPSKISKCVKRGGKLKVKPRGLIAKSTIKEVQLLTGVKKVKKIKKGKKVTKKSVISLKKLATDKTAPFSFNTTLKKSKFKSKRTYYYGFKVVYKDGHVTKTKSAKFKTCR